MLDLIIELIFVGVDEKKNQIIKVQIFLWQTNSKSQKGNEENKNSIINK